jgi:hypothetical protein
MLSFLSVTRPLHCQTGATAANPRPLDPFLLSSLYNPLFPAQKYGIIFACAKRGRVGSRSPRYCTRGHTRICTRFRTRSHTCILTRICTRLLTRSHTNILTDICTRFRTRSRTNILTDICTRFRTRSRTDILTDICTRFRTRSYTNILTDICTRFLDSRDFRLVARWIPCSCPNSLARPSPMPFPIPQFKPPDGTVARLDSRIDTGCDSRSCTHPVKNLALGATARIERR